MFFFKKSQSSSALQPFVPRCTSEMNIERYAFYEEAKNCFAVVHTLERRPYGNVILVKGVIGPDGNDLRPS